MDIHKTYLFAGVAQWQSGGIVNHMLQVRLLSPAPYLKRSDFRWMVRLDFVQSVGKRLRIVIASTDIYVIVVTGKKKFLRKTLRNQQKIEILENYF